jgi:glycosyltransferase involved in cell wall biosynthesis
MMAEQPIRIMNIITSLSLGGAEMMLYKLLSRMDRREFEPSVLSLTADGPVGEKIRKLGIQVTSLGMKPGIPDPVHFFRLVRILKEVHPDLLQTWMYHSDLMGGLAARISGKFPVVWGIRNSTLDNEYSKKSTLFIVNTLAKLSGWIPIRIVSCSYKAQDIHTRLGYRADKFVVIPNGFDTGLFHPDLSARNSLRDELSLPRESFLIGLVGRFDPQKDHEGFIQAASCLVKQTDQVYFVLAGDGITWQNETLVNWIHSSGLERRFQLLGARKDVPRLTAALDIATSSSAYGEAFPNVIGEALACGVPCVVTDVGDSARIIGEAGMVVPPRNPGALCHAWLEMIRMEKGHWIAMQQAARQIVLDHYDLEEITRRYQDLYRSLI